MIDPKAIATYAQYNEDIILLALFNNEPRGFYVDVGANHPTRDSVTKLFYERGWRGINIEPVGSFHKQLEKERPEDVNLKLGAGEKNGTAILREFAALSGHSTVVESQKKQHDEALARKDYEIQIRPLKDILTEQKVDHIHFLKIDVEGYEYEVIAGNDWRKFRPEVICVEANNETKDWRPLLTRNGYTRFISDGLNEYYVAEEAWGRTKDFADRVVKLDYHALRQHQYESWAADSRELNKLSKLAAEQQRMIDGLRRQADHLSDLAPLSLKNQPFYVRVKRATYGLSVDWLRFKRHSKKQ